MKRIPLLNRIHLSSFSALLIALLLTFGGAATVRAGDTYHYAIFFRDMKNFAAGEQPYNTPMPLYHTKDEAEKAAKEVVADLNKKASSGLRYTYKIEKEKTR